MRRIDVFSSITLPLTLPLPPTYHTPTYPSTYHTPTYPSPNITLTPHLPLPQEETVSTMSEIREEISRLRVRISSDKHTNKEDINKMVALVNDLNLIKKSTWAEKTTLSSRYNHERKINLANKVTSSSSSSISSSSSSGSGSGSSSGSGSVSGRCSGSGSSSINPLSS